MRKHLIKFKDWPIQPYRDVDPNKLVRNGTYLYSHEGSDRYPTSFGHGNIEIPSDFIIYYPECFVELDEADINKLKSYPDAVLKVLTYMPYDIPGVYIGRQFIYD